MKIFKQKLKVGLLKLFSYLVVEEKFQTKGKARTKYRRW